MGAIACTKLVCVSECVLARASVSIIRQTLQNILFSSKCQMFWNSFKQNKYHNKHIANNNETNYSKNESIHCIESRMLGNHERVIWEARLSFFLSLSALLCGSCRTRAGIILSIIHGCGVGWSFRTGDCRYRNTRVLRIFVYSMWRCERW